MKPLIEADFIFSKFWFKLLIKASFFGFGLFDSAFTFSQFSISFLIFKILFWYSLISLSASSFWGLIKSFSILYLSKLNNNSSLGIFFKSSFIFSSIKTSSFWFTFLFFSPFLGDAASLANGDFFPLVMLGLFDFLGDLYIEIFDSSFFFFSSSIISIKGCKIFFIDSNCSNFFCFSSFICSIWFGFKLLYLGFPSIFSVKSLYCV